VIIMSMISQTRERPARRRRLEGEVCRRGGVASLHGGLAGEELTRRGAVRYKGAVHYKGAVRYKGAVHYKGAVRYKGAVQLEGEEPARAACRDAPPAPPVMIPRPRRLS
jgi:hypothetical protein